MTDREQARRDAEAEKWRLRYGEALKNLEESERRGRISDMALEKALARAEQAERKSEDDAACIASLRAETVQAERERDYHARAAEDAFIECEARLAKVARARGGDQGPALVEAIKGLLAAADEAPDDWMYEAEELQACRDALADYEQEQEAAHDARGPVSEERTRRSSC